MFQIMFFMKAGTMQEDIVEERVQWLFGQFGIHARKMQKTSNVVIFLTNGDFPALNTLFVRITITVTSRHLFFDSTFSHCQPKNAASVVLKKKLQKQ